LEEGVKEKERELKNLLQVTLREVENPLSNTRNINGKPRTCTPQFSVQIICHTYEAIKQNKSINKIEELKQKTDPPSNKAMDLE